MPPRKRRRTCGVTAPQPATLPADLLLEIVGRTDAATLVRCAAACRLLRREILSPAFSRRVRGSPDGGVLLGFLCPEGTTFSLLHPATPAAASLAENHLAPFMSRSAADLLEEYQPITSRGGLVVLERPEIDWDRRSLDGERPPDMCVWNPMTGDRTFLPFPPDVGPDDHLCGVYTYVLLTGAADGIGCPFLLGPVSSDAGGSSRCIKVRTVSSDAGGSWGPAMTHAGDPGMPPGVLSIGDNGCDGDAVVIRGVVHWLMGGYVLTYDVGTVAVGMIEFPSDWHLKLHLGSTPDGDLSLFYALYGFTIFYWVMSPGGGWQLRAEVDTLPTLQSLTGPWEEEDDEEEFIITYDSRVEVESVGDQRSSVVLLRLRNLFFVLEVETAEIRRDDRDDSYGVVYTVDLSSRLSAMKMF
ncbi:hypothetical protein ACP70R_019736 [Stipagrostis hirtigluma subsp. patula]